LLSGSHRFNLEVRVYIVNLLQLVVIQDELPDAVRVVLLGHLLQLLLGQVQDVLLLAAFVACFGIAKYTSKANKLPPLT